MTSTASTQNLPNMQEKEASQAVPASLSTSNSTSVNYFPIPSLFSHMPDFPKVLSRPFTPTESKMHYWFQSRENLMPHEIQCLLHDVRYIRYTSKAAITHRVDKTSIILSLCGFCSYIDRDVFLRMMRYAFQPRLIYASEITQHQWEAVLILNPRKYSPQLTFNGRDQFIDHVQKFCDIFKLSICVMELVSWTDPATITAIQCIQKGFRIWGNWENFSNNDLRLEFEMAQELKSQAMMNDAVRSVTNRDFTTGNMIHLHHELQNALLDNDQLLQTNVRIANSLRSTMRYLLDVHAMLNQEATQIQHLNVTTYTFRLADNQQRLRATANNNQANPTTTSSTMPFTDLSHFSALVQDLQQQNQRHRTSVADMRRTVHNSLNQNALAIMAHDIQARNARNNRNSNAGINSSARHSSRIARNQNNWNNQNYQNNQNINNPNLNILRANSASTATTPLQTVSPDETTTQYTSPLEPEYPSSPIPQPQSPIPVNPTLTNTTTQNIEVIDLTQDDQPLTPQLSFQIPPQAGSQMPQNNFPRNEMPSLWNEIQNYLPTRRSQARAGALPRLVD